MLYGTKDLEMGFGHLSKTSVTLSLLGGLLKQRYQRIIGIDISKNELGPEGSSISSTYRLPEAVDELESGMGMKSWKKGFVSFSETVC